MNQRPESRPSTVAPVIGAAALALAAIVLIAGVLDPRGFLALARSSSATFTLEARRLERYGTALPPDARSALVEIQYPAKMRENETLPVTMWYQVQRVPLNALPDSFYPSGAAPRPRMVDQLDLKLVVELSSSGFKIAPREQEERMRGTRLPLGVAWTITPEGEGQRRYLLLTIREEIGGVLRNLGDSSVAKLAATVNGSPVKPNQAGAFQFPIAVRTYSGVPRWLVSLGGLILAFIAYVALHPTFVEWLNRKLGLGQDKTG